MHPLNGPAWSLFFEYVANILYAVLIRKFTSRWLAVLVFLAGCALIHQCYTQGNNIGGWTLDAEQCRVGLTRLMFPLLRRPAPVPPVQTGTDQAWFLVVQPASGGSAGGSPM